MKKRIVGVALSLLLGILSLIALTLPARASLYVTPYIHTTCGSLSYVRFRLTDGSTNFVYPCTTERHQVTAVYNYLGEGGRCWNHYSGVTVASWGSGYGWVPLPSIVRASGYHLDCHIT